MIYEQRAKKEDRSAALRKRRLIQGADPFRVGQERSADWQPQGTRVCRTIRKTTANRTGTLGKSPKLEQTWAGRAVGGGIGRSAAPGAWAARLRASQCSVPLLPPFIECADANGNEGRRSRAYRTRLSSEEQRGERLRDDGFFTPKDGHRADAEELLEGRIAVSRE